MKTISCAEFEHLEPHIQCHISKYHLVPPRRLPTGALDVDDLVRVLFRRHNSNHIELPPSLARDGDEIIYRNEPSTESLTTELLETFSGERDAEFEQGSVPGSQEVEDKSLSWIALKEKLNARARRNDTRYESLNAVMSLLLQDETSLTQEYDRLKDSSERLLGNLRECAGEDAAASVLSKADRYGSEDDALERKNRGDEDEDDNDDDDDGQPPPASGAILRSPRLTTIKASPEHDELEISPEEYRMITRAPLDHAALPDSLSGVNQDDEVYDDGHQASQDNDDDVPLDTNANPQLATARPDSIHAPIGTELPLPVLSPSQGPTDSQSQRQEREYLRGVIGEMRQVTRADPYTRPRIARSSSVFHAPIPRRQMRFPSTGPPQSREIRRHNWEHDEQSQQLELPVGTPGPAGWEVISIGWDLPRPREPENPRPAWPGIRAHAPMARVYRPQLPFDASPRVPITNIWAPARRRQTTIEVATDGYRYQYFPSTFSALNVDGHTEQRPTPIPVEFTNELYREDQNQLGMWIRVPGQTAPGPPPRPAPRPLRRTYNDVQLRQMSQSNQFIPAPPAPTMLFPSWMDMPLRYPGGTVVGAPLVLPTSAGTGNSSSAVAGPSTSISSGGTKRSREDDDDSDSGPRKLPRTSSSSSSSLMSFFGKRPREDDADEKERETKKARVDTGRTWTGILRPFIFHHPSTPIVVRPPAPRPPATPLPAVPIERGQRNRTIQPSEIPNGPTFSILPSAGQPRYATVPNRPLILAETSDTSGPLPERTPSGHLAILQPSFGRGPLLMRPNAVYGAHGTFMPAPPSAAPLRRTYGISQIIPTPTLLAHQNHVPTYSSPFAFAPVPPQQVIPGPPPLTRRRTVTAAPVQRVSNTPSNPIIVADDNEEEEDTDNSASGSSSKNT